MSPLPNRVASNRMLKVSSILKKLAFSLRLYLNVLLIHFVGEKVKMGGGSFSRRGKCSQEECDNISNEDCAKCGLPYCGSHGKAIKSDSRPTFVCAKCIKFYDLK